MRRAQRQASTYGRNIRFRLLKLGVVVVGGSGCWAGEGWDGGVVVVLLLVVVVLLLLLGVRREYAKVDEGG